MSDLTKADPELLEKYAVMREGLYLLNQVKVDIIKRAIEDPKAADKIGEGFFIVAVTRHLSFAFASELLRRMLEVSFVRC